MMKITPLVEKIYRHFINHPKDKRAEELVQSFHNFSLEISGQSTWEAFQKEWERNAVKIVFTDPKGNRL